MESEPLFRKYQSLQAYVGWSNDDAIRIRSAAPLCRTSLAMLIDDFYQQIERNPETRKIITGGPAQIERLRRSLSRWLDELLSGRYDEAYVARRWQVGRRHLEIGLDQVYTNAALSRLRRGLSSTILKNWAGSADELDAVLASLNRLMDLDLAIIEDAYQTERAARQRVNQENRLAQVKEQSEAAFRLLVDAADCLILILRPDGSVIYISPFAERLTGFRDSEIVGRDFLQTLIVDEDRQAAGDALARVADGRLTSGFESRVACRDGLGRWIAWNARPLSEFEGGSALLMVGQDISYIKKIQERTLREERLAAIGQMVAGLAHESRNALQRSQACLEMLVLTVPDRPEALDLIGRIQQAQDHVHHIYEDVCAYSAPIVLDRRPCDLGETWREAWSHLEAARRDKIATLEERIDGVNLHCDADRFRLVQVFRNLLENSLAAGAGSPSAPTRIVIRAAETRLDQAPALRIEVIDNGPGLSAEQCRKAFDPFFTTKTKGTGLGLAIVKRIIEAHGGRIGAEERSQVRTETETELGSGALFHITIPRDLS